MYQASNIYFICAIAALGGGFFGFDIGSTAGILGTSAYKRFYHNPVSYVQGSITAALPVGSFVGSLLSSFVADRWSRKTALQLGCVFWIVGSCILCASQGILMLYIGRAVAGLGVGIASSIAPVYQSEIAPKEIRGRVIGFQQWAINWGVLISYLVQSGIVYAVSNGPSDPDQPNLAFRLPWAIQTVPAIVLLVTLSFFPHSPRWLAKQDRWEEAHAVLARLLGDGDKSHARVEAAMRELREGLLREQSDISGGSWKTMLKPNIARRVVLGMSIQMWSQLCGMNFLLYYAAYIMQGAHIASPLVTTSIQYIINVVLCVPAIVFIDKAGRRLPLICGSFVLMIWLLVTGALQQHFGQVNTDATRTTENEALTWIVLNNRPVSIAIVACSYLFVATYATTWGPVSWVYPAEISPSTVRAKANSLSTASNWLWNCVLVFGVPPLLYNISYRMYYVFGFFNLVACLHMFFAAPETKGLTLSEIDDVFNSGHPAWKKYDTTHLFIMDKKVHDNDGADAKYSSDVKVKVLDDTTV